MINFVTLKRSEMARRKKKRNRGRVSIIVVLLVVVIAYSGGMCSSNGAKDVMVLASPEKSLDTKHGIIGEESSNAGTKPANVEEESSSEDLSAPSSRKRKQRAKGLEIPAYLTDRDEEIVMHEGFTLSYNKKHLVPNWVAWVLTSKRALGTLKRKDNFQPDTTIKHGPIAQLSDYRLSGYDRGHMCPSADNKHSREAMEQSCLLSNICPQTPKNNAGDWAQLEDLCRKWAVAYDSIYIVCGPIIEKGEEYETIGDNKVTVPRQFFKVVLRWTGDDSAEAIGFIMNNDDSDRPIYTYAVTVDSVENRTGINFFSKLPKKVERRAEAQFDCSQWQSLQK